MLPEARIAVTTYVAIYLALSAVLGRRRWTLSVTTALAGFAVVGCWQLWALAAAIGAGGVALVAATISQRRARSDRADSATAWIVRAVATATTVGVVVTVVFYAMSKNPYTWIDQTGPVLYAIVVLVSGGVVVVARGSSFMSTAIRPFAEQLRLRSGATPAGIDPPDGFISGGRTIGRYERFLVYMLVIANAPTAIGFLIAAKSIFRFGDITDSVNRQKAEYILLGTLMSFTFALLVSFITRSVLEWY